MRGLSREHLLLAPLRLSVAAALAILVTGTTAGERAVESSAADPTSAADSVAFARCKALIVEGRYEEATAAAREILAAVSSRDGETSLSTASAHEALATALSFGGRSDEPDCLGSAERALAIREALLGSDDPALAVAATLLGDILLNRGQYEEARPLLERGLRIREAAFGPDHLEVAISLYALARLHTQTGKHASARPLLERCLAIREARLDPASENVLIPAGVLASFLIRDGAYAEARARLEALLPHVEGTLGPDHPRTMYFVELLASALLFLGENTEALVQLERALAHHEARLGPEHPILVKVLANLAMCHWQLGRPERQVPLLERALAIGERAYGPEHYAIATTIYQLGEAYWNRGEYERARTFFERAIRIREAQLGPDDASLAVPLIALATSLSMLGDYEEARPLFERALAVQAATLGPDHSRVGDGAYSYAFTLMRAGDLEAAQPLCERAIRIFEKSFGPEHAKLASSLDLHGKIRLLDGDLAEAASLFERALAMRKAVREPWHVDLAESYGDIGLVRLRRGDLDGARAALTHALAICDTLPDEHPSRTGTLRLLALTERRAGNTQRSVSLALETERTSRDHLRLMLQTLPDRAALRYVSVRNTGLDLAFSTVTEEGGPETVRPVWDALVASRAAVLDEMATRRRILTSSGDAAVDSLRAALSRLTSELASRVLSSGGGQANSDEIALAHDVRARKESIERALASRSVEFRRERERQAIGLDDVTAALPDSSALVAFARYRQIPVASESENSAPGEDITALDAGTPSYAAFVLPRVGAAPEIVPLGPAAPIDALVATWRDELQHGAELPGRLPAEAEAACRTAGQLLRAAVWDRVAPRIEAAARVFVVPDGQLHLVSFGALPVDGGFLVDGRHVLHGLTAERDLVRGPADAVDVGGELLAIGAADYDAPCGSLTADLALGGTYDLALALPADAPRFRGSAASCLGFADVAFPALPATGEEVREIADLFGREHALQLTADAANEAAFKALAGGHRVLHVATHGFFLDDACSTPDLGTRGVGGVLASTGGASRAESGAPLENPLVLSGLVLAGANSRSRAGPDDEDGLLTAEEIASLDLGGTEWAVLSACQSGLGEVRAGEGVLGLRRAFAVAGVRTVIMSLWAVEDECTREWMRQLYRARQRDGLDTAGAVRAASRAVLAERRATGESTHPYYWAAFVASGDWR